MREERLDDGVGCVVDDEPEVALVEARELAQHVPGAEIEHLRLDLHRGKAAADLLRGLRQLLSAASDQVDVEAELGEAAGPRGAEPLRRAGDERPAAVLGSEGVAVHAPGLAQRRTQCHSKTRARSSMRT
jgi:hypothetical protein